MSSARPHIFLIMTDQQKASATSLYGNRFVRTPTWERVAARGVTFDQAYAQAPICTPSRASIMTGTYPLVHRVLCHQNFAPENLGQLPEFLTSAGYRCIAAGHYEAKRGLNRGWRDEIDLVATPRLLKALRSGQTCGSRRVGWSAGETALGPEDSPAAVLNDELIGLLDGIDPASEPLFVHVAYIEPHAPYFAPIGRLDQDAMRRAPLPEAGRMEERPAWHRRMLEDYGSAEATDLDKRRLLGAYYGSTSYVDGQIDRLLQYLERRGLLDDSWVILTSDHGDYAAEKDFYTKSESVYECLLHVPLVVRGPRGQWHPGTRVKELTELLDLFPTILSAAGCAVPRQNQGHNLIGWLDGGGKTPLRQAAFSAVGGYLGPLKTTMPHGLPESGRRKGIVRGARSPTHLYVRDPDVGDEAYDLVSDPLELRDLLRGGRPAPPPIRDLARAMDTWEKACEALSSALGVIPGNRNFDAPVGATTGDPNWSPFTHQP